MLRWILLILALLIAASSVLTTFKAPNLFTWKVAILVDEFGHWLVVLPVILGLVMLRSKAQGPIQWATLALCLLALPFLLKPVYQAWWLARSLPAQLVRSFGPADVGRAPFEFKRLLGLGGVARIEPETKVFAHAGRPDELALDFYRAVHPDGRPAPCIIVIYGGGWDSGDRGQLPRLNDRLARQGYAVAAISYRLAPKYTWPAQRDDILTAIAFLKEHAAGLGLDPTRLVLFGRSAGGNLAEAVGYTAGDPAIRGVVAFYAPADLYYAWENSREGDVLDPLRLLRQFLGGSPQAVPAAYDAASGYLHVGKATPPTLLVHGALDTLVWHRQSERLDARLAENGVAHLFVSLPWGTHAFEVNLDGPGGQIATYALDYFLATVTR
jgi:acetyl esterase/lipase